jgi:hypothetical protein
MAESGTARLGNVGDFVIKGSASEKLRPRVFGFAEAAAGLPWHFYSNNEHGSSSPNRQPPALPQLSIAIPMNVGSLVPNSHKHDNRIPE